MSKAQIRKVQVRDKQDKELYIDQLNAKKFKSNSKRKSEPEKRTSPPTLWCVIKELWRRLS